MKKREEKNLPEMASLGDLVKWLVIGIVLSAPMIIFVIDGATDLANGAGIFSNLIGIKLGHYYIVVVFYQFFLFRCFAVQKLYAESNSDNIESKYESKFLRMTDLLVAQETQEKVMEPMYADWEFERNDLQVKGRIAVFWLDLYYTSWFAWRIWRETGIWRSYKMRKVRNERNFSGMI